MLKQYHPTKSLQEFIRSIIETKSKEEEDRIIIAHIEELKTQINQITNSDPKKIEYAIKAIYSDMLGQDAKFAQIFVIKLIESKNIEVKKIGYISCSLLLEGESDFKILLGASILRDLSSKNDLAIISALNALGRLMNQSSAPGFIDKLSELLSDNNPKIVQKSLVLLQKIERLCPNSIPLYAEKIKKCLGSVKPPIIAAALNVISDECKNNSEIFIPVLKQIVSIQAQIIDKKMNYYDYQKIPEPFMQIKILKIIGELCKGVKKNSEEVYEVLRKTLNRADNLSTDVSYTLVYECVLTITKVFPNNELLELASTAISKFLTSNSRSNLIYLGINCLKNLTNINSKYIHRHQLFVVDCLESKDETIRRITLELLYNNTNANNLEIITEKFIESLKSTTDVLFKADLTRKIFDLCARYCKSSKWLVEKLDLLLEFADDHFDNKMLHDVIGILEENLVDDPEVGEFLVKNYLKYFDKNNISAIMIKLISWVIGSVAITSYSENPEFVKSLAEGLKILLHMKNCDDISKCWIFDSFFKLIKINPAIKNEVLDFISSFEHSENEEVRLKIFELRNFADIELETDFDQHDADFEFSFLLDFVNSKRGKFFDPEIAEQYEGINTNNKEFSSLKFKNEETVNQKYEMGSENKDIIIQNPKESKWSTTGYKKDEKEEQKKKEIEAKKKEYFDSKKPVLQIFDDIDKKSKNNSSIPEKKKNDSEEKKKKRTQQIANKMFDMFGEGDDIFAKNNDQKITKEVNNSSPKEIDFFAEKPPEKTSVEKTVALKFEEYKISQEEYEELWGEIDNQIEKDFKIKKLKNEKNIKEFLEKLGFYLVSKNEEDYITASKANGNIILMYLQLVKPKNIEIIINCKDPLFTNTLISNIEKYK
jgi:AP-4 complex subunit epsilon-1